MKKIRRWITILAVLAVIIGGGAASASVRPAAVQVSPSSTVTLEVGFYNCHYRDCWVIRPKHFQLEDGPEVWIAHMGWSHWGTRNASGWGGLWEVINSHGALRLGHVHVHLYRPSTRRISIRLGKGAAIRVHYFTRLHFSGRGKYGKVAGTLRWHFSPEGRGWN
ncbi:MAG: hypothetical protein ACLQDY_00260 [Streptosporangiaceae bacterium]